MPSEPPTDRHCHERSQNPFIDAARLIARNHPEVRSALREKLLLLGHRQAADITDGAALVGLYLRAIGVAPDDARERLTRWVTSVGEGVAPFDALRRCVLPLTAVTPGSTLGVRPAVRLPDPPEKRTP